MFNPRFFNLNFFRFLIIVLTLLACNKSEIKLSKLNNSLKNFNNSELILKKYTVDNENNYLFDFEVSDFSLGKQTPNDFNFDLANSSKGQHIHLIVNNGPYFAKYSNSFKQKLKHQNNTILAFLSRSHHESVKSEKAYSLIQTGNEKFDSNTKLLFYSRPKGEYIGSVSKKILLDFYLVNTEISKDGNKVKVTIDESEFIVTDWEPYLIEGLNDGEHTIKIELIDSIGNLIPSPYNSASRIITVEN
tara:strand:+ start:853 stop:1590 length:738 start_codon:yes stop_codon:yes gene_type:complete